MEEVEKVIDNLNPPPNDPWEYRILILKNGIKCLLIRNPETESASACLNVGVGAYKDPVEF